MDGAQTKYVDFKRLNSFTMITSARIQFSSHLPQIVCLAVLCGFTICSTCRQQHPTCHHHSPWQCLLAAVPLGDHPLLEVNGRIMTQPLAITRFVAAHCRLDAYTEHDRAFAESIVDSCLQVRQAGIAVAGLDVTDKAKVGCNWAIRTSLVPTGQSNS